MKTSRPCVGPRIELLEARIAPAVIYGIDDNNDLFSFDSKTPGTITSSVPITGLQAGEKIVAIDFRPATGGLYGLAISDNGATDAGRLYQIFPTGAAVPVGPAFSTSLPDNASYGFDFNPTSDKIRVTSSSDLSFRLSPVTGGVTDTDPLLHAATGGESITGIGYSSNYAGAAATNLFGFNSETNSLVVISANDGVVTPVGPSSVTPEQGAQVGLDVLSDSTGQTIFGSFRTTVNTVAAYRLYVLDGGTGQSASLGQIGSAGMTVNDIAVRLPAPHPVTLLNSKTATYTDGDGDLVTVKVSKGTLSADDFAMIPAPAGGFELARLDLTDVANNQHEFQGASVTITAKPGPNGGNGFANVGFLDAPGVDLGKVTVHGDLGRILAGDPALPAPGIASLSVQSVGRLSYASQGGYGSLVSHVEGKLGALIVASDFFDATLDATTDIGQVKIGGSLVGSSAAYSGAIVAKNLMGSVAIGQSISGGSGENSGRLLAHQFGAISIGDSIYGGSGAKSGFVGADNADGSRLSKLTVGGNIIGGSGMGSGSVIVFGPVGSVVVGGNLGGGSEYLAGAILAGSIGSVSVKHDILGGKAPNTGFIGADGGSIGSIFVGGTVYSGTGDSSVTMHANSIGAITVRGSLEGSASHPVMIGVLGVGNPTNQAASVAIKSLSVGGRAAHARIIAGVTKDFVPINPNVSVGSVTVGGDWLASDLAVGIHPGADGYYGNGDVLSGFGDSRSDIVARVASLTIKGQVLGTLSAGDHHGIVAEQFSAVTIGGIQRTLQAGVKDNLILSPFGDLRLVEV